MPQFADRESFQVDASVAGGATDWFRREQLEVPERYGRTRALFEQHGVSARGVVHVGGSVGEELETYLALGFEKILYVEPNPEVFRRLEEHLDFWRGWLSVMRERYGAARVPRLDGVMCAAGDRAGTATLHVAQNAGESSLLRPDPCSIRAAGEVSVSTERLDDLVADLGLGPDSFSLLVLDVQGAELLALQGAPRLLEVLDMVVVEVNFSARYFGSALEPQVERFFVERSYRGVVRRRASPQAPAGDVAYVRDRGGPRQGGRPS